MPYAPGLLARKQIVSYTNTLPGYLDGLDLSCLGDAVTAVRVSTFTALDRQTLRLYRWGSPAAEKLILLPPYGITFLLLSPLARCLSQRFEVLSWESAGCPSADDSLCGEPTRLDRQSAQLGEIVRVQGLEEFHFVGWCQAAQLCVYSLAAAHVRPRTLTWIAPAGLGHGLVKSEFDRCALPIYLEIERQGVAQAEKLGRILDKYRDQSLTAANVAEKLTMLHLSDPQMTYRFARYMRAYVDNQAVVRSLLDDVLETPRTQVIHCKDDTYSHFSESVELAKMYPGMRLELLPRGGHLHLFRSPQLVAELIFKHIDRECRPASESPARLAQILE